MFVTLLMALVAAGNSFNPQFNRLDIPEEFNLQIRFIEQSTDEPMDGELWLMSDYYGGFTEHLVSSITQGEASLQFVRLEEERFYILNSPQEHSADSFGRATDGCVDDYAPYNSYASYVFVIKSRGEIYRSVPLDQPLARSGKAGSEVLEWAAFNAGIRNALASLGNMDEVDGVFEVSVEGYVTRRFSFVTVDGEPLANQCFNADIFLFQSNHCGVEETLSLDFPLESGPDGVAIVNMPKGPLSISLSHTAATRVDTYAARPVLTSERYITGWETDTNIVGALDCLRRQYAITLIGRDQQPLVGVILNGILIEEVGCGLSSGRLSVTGTDGKAAFELCPNLMRPLGFSLVDNADPMAQDYLISELQCLELFETGELTITCDLE